MSDSFRRSRPAKRLILELVALGDRVAPGGAAGGVAEACRVPVASQQSTSEQFAQTAGPAIDITHHTDRIA